MVAISKTAATDLVYAYCQPTTDLFGGGVYAVVGQVPLLANPVSWRYAQREELLAVVEPQVEALIEEGELLMDQHLILPVNLNLAGDYVHQLISKRLGYLVAKYAYEKKLKEYQVVLCDRYALPVKGASCIQDYKCAQCQLIRAIAYILRHGLIINNYDKLYPHYELNSNFGILNEATTPLVLSADFNPRFMLSDTLKNSLPYLFMKCIEKPQPRSSDKLAAGLLPDCFTAPPGWWYYFKEDNTAFFEPAEEKAHQQLVGGKYSPAFKKWLHCTPKHVLNNFL